MNLAAKLKPALIAAIACAVTVHPKIARAAEQVSQYFIFEAPAQSKQQRLLDFPKDVSLGEVVVLADLNNDTTIVSKCQARGRVTIPAKRLCWFRPAKRFFQNPEVITTLPPNAIDKISLEASSFEDTEEGLCDRSLKYIGHLKGLVALEMDRSDASDKGASHAAELPDLQKFSAFIAELNGSCFKDFSQLPKLRCIQVAQNGIKDENLKYLAAVPNLQYLDLAQNNLCDKGVHDLANCHKLVTLSLSQNQKITDKSMEIFATLKDLRELKLHRTAITVDALLRLKNPQLLLLDLPREKYSDYDIKRLHQAFPKAKLLLDEVVKPVDSDTKKLFAPLH